MEKCHERPGEKGLRLRRQVPVRQRMPVQSLHVQALQLLSPRPVTTNEASPDGGASTSERWVKRIFVSSVSAVALVALPAPISAQAMHMPGMTMPMPAKPHAKKTPPKRKTETKKAPAKKTPAKRATAKISAPAAAREQHRDMGGMTMPTSPPQPSGAQPTDHSAMEHGTMPMPPGSPPMPPMDHSQMPMDHGGMAGLEHGGQTGVKGARGGS